MLIMTTYVNLEEKEKQIDTFSHNYKLILLFKNHK